MSCARYSRQSRCENKRRNLSEESRSGDVVQRPSSVNWVCGADNGVSSKQHAGAPLRQISDIVGDPRWFDSLYISQAMPLPAILSPAFCIESLHSVHESWPSHQVPSLIIRLGTRRCPTTPRLGGSWTLASANMPSPYLLATLVTSTLVSRTCTELIGGFDGALISGLLANRIFLYDVGFTDPNKIGIMIAGSALGGLPSTFMVPYVADRFGRRITFVIGAVFTIVGGLLQTFLKGGWPMFGGRFVMGFGTSFAGVGSAMYVAEVAHPRLRPQPTALYGTNYYIGSIIAAWTTYGSLKIANSWSWKLCTILQCVPGALQLMILPFVEESPRFLMARGKVAEAQRVLAKYHANGEEDDELVRFEMETIAMNVSEAAAHKTEGSYRDFLRTPGNRKRLFIVVVSASSPSGMR